MGLVRDLRSGIYADPEPGSGFQESTGSQICNIATTLEQLPI
jgi:hypothetical protein